MIDLKLTCLVIVGLPLIAAILTGLGRKIIGKTVAHLLTTLSVFISCFLSVWLLAEFYQKNIIPENFNLYTWGEIGGYRFHVGFWVDELSVLMMAVVSFVSAMVHLYTVGYMAEDEGYIRFFSYISLFTFGMLMLVSANNFLQLFFGWEMVGLMSYLLIGFWFQKESAIQANLKAFIVNRVGDFGFIIGIAAILSHFGTLDYETIFQSLKEIPPLETTFICLGLLIGAMGKSAQVPLHVWLPDSMEGPTPISALIHAATMVTAGVFMIARLSPLFEYSEVALNTILIIGSITCLLTGLIGIVQDDIKRVIAYSTLSQLGYMMVAMGASAYSIGIFHLATHAFFKALLFLGAGAVILGVHHEQNIWRMGGLKKSMPVTYYTFLIGSLALIGFPFFSGFYSKDLIIEAVKGSHLPAANMAYVVVLGSVFITALYTFRLFFVVFHNQKRYSVKEIVKTPMVMKLPLILLAIPSVVSGLFFLAPLQQNYFQNSLVMDKHAEMINPNPWIMGLHGFCGLPFWFGLLGIITAWLVYVRYPSASNRIQHQAGFLYKALKNQLGFDKLYQCTFVAWARGLGDFCWRLGDEWAIDGLGVNGVARLIRTLSFRLKSLQMGYLYHYAFVMILGFLLLVFWVLFSEYI